MPNMRCAHACARAISSVTRKLHECMARALQCMDSHAIKYYITASRHISIDPPRYGIHHGFCSVGFVSLHVCGGSARWGLAHGLALKFNL